MLAKALWNFGTAALGLMRETHSEVAVYSYPSKSFKIGPTYYKMFVHMHQKNYALIVSSLGNILLNRLKYKISSVSPLQTALCLYSKRSCTT